MLNGLKPRDNGAVTASGVDRSTLGEWQWHFERIRVWWDRFREWDIDHQMWSDTGIVIVLLVACLAFPGRFVQHAQGDPLPSCPCSSPDMAPKSSVLGLLAHRRSGLCPVAHCPPAGRCGVARRAVHLGGPCRSPTCTSGSRRRLRRRADGLRPLEPRWGCGQVRRLSHRAARRRALRRHCPAYLALLHGFAAGADEAARTRA